MEDWILEKFRKNCKRNYDLKKKKEKKKRKELLFRISRIILICVVEIIGVKVAVQQQCHFCWPVPLYRD